ncbi:MAG TPA: dihydrodipicolinate synthase family protein [Stellaceae bacterium]|nr:dihydrodipicolinate synthase family protein [Stellaceae bacterium]
MTQPQSSPPRGVYAAVLTPVGDDLAPNTKAFIAHCRWLLANGCDGLAPLGTTGEANSLSLAQRLGLIEASVAAGLPMERCIIGTGSCALADAVTLTKAMLAAGCTGALLLPPFYYKNPSEDGLFAFFSEVIQRVGDKRLKLYLYHFPQMSAVPVTPALVLRLKAAYGDTIAGVKDSSGDWTYTANLLKEIPGFGVYSGSEQFLLANLRAGGAGCISASTNVTAPLAQRVFRAWQQAETDPLQEQLTAARLVLQAFPFQGGLKELVARVSGDAKWVTPLPPNRALSPAEREQLFHRVKEVRGLAPLLQAA